MSKASSKFITVITLTFFALIAWEPSYGFLWYLFIAVFLTLLYGRDKGPTQDKGEGRGVLADLFFIFIWPFLGLVYAFAQALKEKGNKT
jgi:hypothetical protein